jgi:hypothetical protein
MKGRPARFLLGMAAVSLLVSACDGGEPKAKAGVAPRFDIEKFTDSTRIDNPWLPFTPGTRFTFEGEVRGPRGPVPERAVLTVTDVTKVIAGVPTLVMWDQDYSGGQLSEAELTFVAQDDEGTVWLMGEYPEEYDGEKFSGAPRSWIAGQAGAKPGILMPAKPRKGEGPYVQGMAPDVDFYDVARVHRTGEQTCVPAGCYADVMVIDEWDPLDQPGDGHQLKYQARGVGNVKVEGFGTTERETLVLTKIEQLGPEALAVARREALRLDQRAYLVNARYAETPRAEPCVGPCGGLKKA